LKLSILSLTKQTDKALTEKLAPTYKLAPTMTTAICFDLMEMVGNQVEVIQSRQYWMELYVNRYHNTIQAVNQIVRTPELNAIHTRLSKGLTDRPYAQPYLNKDVDFNIKHETNHLHLNNEIIHGNPDYDSEYDTDSDDDY
tara:strand:- start:300 stop:722 length:423 start_codon:yes stop_codon:yes gene_type:complete